MLPRVTDCELVEDPRRFVAAQRYSPASVGPMLLMDSDGVFTVPPEYLALSEMSRFWPFSNQYTDVCAGEPCDTLTVQWMVTVVSVSVIVPGSVTVGFSKIISLKYIKYTQTIQNVINTLQSSVFLSGRRHKTVREIFSCL